jgi:hypothetical protein
MLTASSSAACSGTALGLFNGTVEDTADNGDGKDVAGRVVLSFAGSANRWLKGLHLAGNAAAPPVR